MAPVQIYVYDLSGGIINAVSKQMLGKHFEGIWHTSIVAFGWEIHYRRETGIQINNPGEAVVRCGNVMKRGPPVKILDRYKNDKYKTSYNEQTFADYLKMISGSWTPEKYNLLTHNCISFTMDCIRFLTGQSIPSWIKDLPSKFTTAVLKTCGGAVDVVAYLTGGLKDRLIDLVAALLKMVGNLTQIVKRLGRDIVERLGNNFVIGLALIIVACLVA